MTDEENSKCQKFLDSRSELEKIAKQKNEKGLNVYSTGEKRFIYPENN